MKEPDLPGTDHVPDHVLDELQTAFSDPTPNYDFDDPALDRMLGIDDADEADDDTGDDTGDVDFDDDADDDDADDVEAVEADEVPSAAPERRTIVIADDELPDLVYLDEEKERGFHERRDAAAEDSTRSTIVIDDLDDYGVIEPAPTRTAGGIDPRMRARRNAVSREQGRRRVLLLGIAGGVVLAIILVVAVFASSVFDVRTVYVQGAVYTDQELLDKVVNDLKGHAVLLADTHKAEQDLEAIPWVEQATVRTDFPHSVYIDIRERRPIVTFQGHDGQFRVIDIQGRVLDVIAGQPTAYLLVTGQNPDTPRGDFAPAPYAAAAQMVVGLPAEIRSITTSVGVDTATGGLTMLLNETVNVRLGDLRNLDEKLARLLGQIRQGLKKVCELDVSTEEVGAVPCTS
ncbi:MAG: FtsQ-type POTRA domain-containing protein [Actinobacteria bacterium]|uniref:Unannotated protein n=1 Tax=freshwater metagenome TaxID=449393 RepID=A0A6J6SCZ0_9ZZZZ|nr:FtsQ-type POTRA domain-containing protein [Actinomycetota bacterium]MSW78738.1 FtsQ-type POTRA domain-containing protein [Actinomycetota bacterium]MSX56722.1 FtsQ-type POTRA domain-containing protein [Actinomycetota bacterium]MSX93110.1 FtsQ-type POTRA domain-containing protein [Actinomycetota bacterium]MSZ83692.1 FtsQ-type POTRA domain-containing protein [Actinomycetota bacterium]